MFLVVLLRTAWVCDDAYITFRTVANFANGYGLTWNVAERVQAFTHPLWLFVVTAAFLFTGEVYFTSLVLSIVFSLLALVVLLTRIATSVAGALLAGLALLLSKAFTDYSTSGLENALTHALLAVFWAIYFSTASAQRKVLLLAFVAALGMTNRMDTVLLFAPALLYVVIQTRRWQSLFLVGLGFLPFVLWTGFALFYYGFPFPNTAYAKLNTGIDAPVLAYQGVLYLFNSLSLDPVTLTIIVGSIVWAGLARRPAELPVVLAILLYLAYTVRIGGDFMSGRFLAAPLFCAAVLLARRGEQLAGLPALALVAAPLLIIGLATPLSPLRSGADYQTQVPLSELFARLPEQNGITDERAFYYRYTGLLRSERSRPWPTYFLPVQARLAQQQNPAVVVWAFTGFFGYSAGPQTHIVDSNALSDPLLARLPARYDPEWRIGHFTRVVPDGYLETLRHGENRISDPDLARYYDALAIITRGPLFDAQRLATIWRFQRGDYGALVNESRYRYPELQVVELAILSSPLTAGAAPDDPRARPFAASGLLVRLPAPSSTALIEVSLDNNDGYRLRFLRDETEVGHADLAALTYHDNRLEIPVDQLVPPGFAVHRVPVPQPAADAGFNHIHIVPLYGDAQYAVGHLLLEPSD